MNKSEKSGVLKSFEFFPFKLAFDLMLCVKIILFKDSRTLVKYTGKTNVMTIFV